MKTMARPRDKAEIVRRLKMVRPDCKRKWGRMSAHQMVCHLSDSFRMVTRQKATSPATRCPARPEGGIRVECGPTPAVKSKPVCEAVSSEEDTASLSAATAAVFIPARRFVQQWLASC